MKVNKILFDLEATQPNASGQRHGGGKYGEIVLLRMVELGVRPVCFYNSHKWLNPDMKSMLEDNKIKMVDLSTTNLEQLVKDEQADVLFSCLPTSEENHLEGCRVLVTLHGLRDMETPRDKVYWRYRGHTFKNMVRFFIESHTSWRKGVHMYHNILKGFPSHQIVTVSKHTNASIKSFFPEYRDLKAPVFFSPSTSSNVPVAETKYQEKYFLMVSGNRWEKNNLRAIMALDRLFSNGFLEGYTARITGAKDASIYKYKIKNPERFHFMGYVDEHELEQLYHDAYAFIYPSLNEGFGYPPMEAMRYGIPVLCSPFSSIPEVCQGAAMYFNPLQVEEIMNRIIQITDSETHQDFSLRALRQYDVITAKQKSDLDAMIRWIENGGE